MPSWERERYELVLGRDGVTISAGSAEGAFRAEATLRQLAMPFGNQEAPEVTINDSPRFAWRGLMLDVARHFLPASVIEAVIDRMALYKLNVLHLHLSDDQGFRVELTKHPELTQVGAFRNEGGKTYGGFYTKADIQRIVGYARDKFVTILPEIDLPGHTRAILAAHPELSCTMKKQEVPSTFGIFDDVLCAGNDATLALVSDVIAEVASLFPGPYLHVGGDEVPVTRWSECPKCRARMAKEGLANVHELQPWFSRAITKLVRANGKTPIGWDEMAESSLDPRTTIMAWRGLDKAGAAVAMGHPVVLAPMQVAYLNAPQPGQPLRDFEEPLSLEKVLRFDPSGVASGANGRLVLGGEAALWTEYVHDLLEIDEQLFPRLPALAERFWSEQKAASTSANADFLARLRAQLPSLSALGIGYYVEPPRGLEERTVFLRRAEAVLTLPPVYDASIEVRLDDGSPFTYTHPIVIERSTGISAVTVLRGGRRSRPSMGTFVREALRPARWLPPSSRGESPVALSFYEGAFERVPDFTRMEPSRRVTSLGFDLTQAPRANDYALSATSNFVAPMDGVYTFLIKSDDGAILSVDGERVVDNDGRHAPRERRGQIALSKGAHALVLGYFQAKGGAFLEVDVLGPDLTRRPLRGTELLAP